nr:hypothetical protein [uncultured Allomuricauda sp.]
MRYNRKIIAAIIEKAIDDLFEVDLDIMSKSYNINERTITHRLANHLEKYFIPKGYVVDVEYNRMKNDYGEDIIGNEIGKRLDFEKYGLDSKNVYPDIIVHKRNQSENLVEIEVKMEWKNQNREFDFLKINEYMSQLGYAFGVYIQLSEGRENCKIEFGPFEMPTSISN